MGAWVGVVKKCGARTAATRVSVSGNLGDLFDIVSQKSVITIKTIVPMARTSNTNVCNNNTNNNAFEKRELSSI